MSNEGGGKPTVKELMTMSPADVKKILGSIYEHSAWVAEVFIEKKDILYKDIETITQLSNAMKDIVENTTQERKLSLLCAHPDLCEKVGKLENLTKDSQEEQSRSGLQSLTEDELKSFTNTNKQYREKFGFPFILAVRNATKYTVLSALQGRVNNPYQIEFTTAIQQVHKIAWMRLLTKINTTDAKGFLTCHVLDTANGCPAARMKIELYRILDNTKVLIKEYITNDDGRLENGPALKGGTEFIVGVYEWIFYTGDYFASKGTFISGTPFLDIIPIRFGIDNPDDHYHVPLLVSPWSYSTYRGS